jgi:hypothetical protein
MGKSQTRQDLRRLELQFLPPLAERSATCATRADPTIAQARAGIAEQPALRANPGKLKNLVHCICAGTLSGIEELSVAG